MQDRRIRIARVLVTIPALFLAIAPPLADLNATHVGNPLWSAHARLHTVWVGLLALGILWRGAQQPARGAVLLASALVGAVLLGFFVAAATQSMYGGALTDPNGIPFQVGPLDANLAGFSVLAVLLAVAVGAVWRPAA